MKEQLAAQAQDFASIEQNVYSNGAAHVYGVDEQGRKTHLGHDDVLAAHGYADRDTEDLKAFYELPAVQKIAEMERRQAASADRQSDIAEGLEAEQERPKGMHELGVRSGMAHVEGFGRKTTSKIREKRLENAKNKLDAAFSGDEEAPATPEAVESDAETDKKFRERLSEGLNWAGEKLAAMRSRRNRGGNDGEQGDGEQGADETQENPAQVEQEGRRFGRLRGLTTSAKEKAQARWQTNRENARERKENGDPSKVRELGSRALAGIQTGAARAAVKGQEMTSKEYWTDQEKGKRRIIVAVAAGAVGIFLAVKGFDALTNGDSGGAEHTGTGSDFVQSPNGDKLRHLNAEQLDKFENMINRTTEVRDQLGYNASGLSDQARQAIGDQAWEQVQQEMAARVAYLEAAA